MSNKYDSLVEEINKKEEIAEQKENLTEQLGQVTKSVNDVKSIVGKLETAIGDLKEITKAITAASQSTDNAVNAITQAILNSREVVVTNKLDDESVQQLQDKYDEYSRQEERIYENHRYDIAQMLERNKDRCYEIINQGDGVYFGRKTFIRLYIVFCTFFGIILLEIAYSLMKLFDAI